jgi:hypothetical protein
MEYTAVMCDLCFYNCYKYCRYFCLDFFGENDGGAMKKRIGKKRKYSEIEESGGEELRYPLPKKKRIIGTRKAKKYIKVDLDPFGGNSQEKENERSEPQQEKKNEVGKLLGEGENEVDELDSAWEYVDIV